MSPKENNKNRINYKRIKVGRPHLPEHAAGMDERSSTYLPTHPPPFEDPLANDEQWMEILRQSYPDRDVAGELRAFTNFCQRKESMPNRAGFIGWLKKASPILQTRKRKLRYTY